MCDGIIGIIGNSVISNFYYYFVLGTLKILLVMLKYTPESCKLWFPCYAVDHYKLSLLSAAFLDLNCFSSLSLFRWSFPLGNHHLILSAYLLIDSFNQLDVNLLNC